MSSLSLENVNTKLEAYKLVHDPTRLLCLLYSKYGDIEEDYYLSYSNQIIYNVSSHFNCIYKENQYIENKDEFLKRLYSVYECLDRIPKLSDYYKNYLKFFCRPSFKNYKLGKLLHDFEDKKAEIFYKNNYADSINEIDEKEKEKENSEKKSSSSLSSLDNITNNKIIFDKRTKKIIDNNLNNDLCTITLTLESSRTNAARDNMSTNDNNNIYNDNGCLISKRSNGNSSFEKYIYSLVNYQWNKKLKNRNKKVENNKKSFSRRKKKLLNSPSNHPPYIARIYKKSNLNSISNNYINKDFFQKSKGVKNSLYTLARKNFKNNCFISYKNETRFLSPKATKHYMNYNNGLSSKLEEFNKNRQNNYKNYIQESAKKNKTYNNNNTNNRASKNKKIKNINYINSNTIYKNFSNLSESLNKYKKTICNKNSNITYSNKNNSGIVKPKKNKINSTNILVKSNNNERKKMKRKINKNINKTINNNQLKTNNFISTNKNSNKNINININNTKPQVRHGKNKTFDFNTINQNDPISKYNSNNNIDKFKVLFSSNNKNNPKKKINSKFNLIKKPIYEVMKNPILSPQIKKVNNKITINQSISQNKEKKKKIFYGLSNHCNNYNIQQTKIEHDSPKGQYSNKKKNSMTFSSEDNKIDNLNIEGIAKKNKRINISKNKKQIKKNNNINLNKFDSIKEAHNNNNNNSNSNNNSNNCKIKTTSISPVSNYSTNFNKNTKNINYSSGNNTIKNDNSSSNNNNSEAIKSTKIINNNNLNTNIENISNNNKTINGELLDAINMNPNDNCVISRNKKQNNSKISSTQSQNEMVKDIKSIKNLKANCIGAKIHIKNMTCCNDSNLIMPKYNINYNFGKINSSTEVKNNHIKDILFKLNKISIKKKAKKNSQRISKKKDKIKFYIKPKNKYKNRGMLSGDNIFNRKKIIEIKQNSLHLNSRTTHKDNNNNVKSNNTISHRERGNSLQIINVNRNINLINKKERKNLQKLTKI